MEVTFTNATYMTRNVAISWRATWVGSSGGMLEIASWVGREVSNDFQMGTYYPSWLGVTTLGVVNAQSEGNV